MMQDDKLDLQDIQDKTFNAIKQQTKTAHGLVFCGRGYASDYQKKGKR